jgi:hypothetical protein
MSLLGRDLKNVIILDNSPTSYYFQPENALASRSWYDEYDDRELYNFLPILKALSGIEDVRPALSQIGGEACDQVGRDIIVRCEDAMKIVMKHAAKQTDMSNRQQEFSSSESIFDHGSQRIIT